MTYNKSEIMKRAWNAVKSMGMTLSDALKASWKKAKQEVKEIADYITSTVEDDGVYDALKHFQLI